MNDNVLVEGIVAVRNQKPYVVLRLNRERIQLTIAEAKGIAADIVQMAARTEADAMILRFFDKMEYPRGAAAAVLKEFRDFRLALDTEPVVNFHVESTEGPTQ